MSRNYFSSLFGKSSPEFPKSIQDLGTFLISLKIKKPKVIEAQTILLSLLNYSIADIKTAEEHETQRQELLHILMDAPTVQNDPKDQIESADGLLNGLLDIIKDQQKQLKKSSTTHVANEHEDEHDSLLVSPLRA